MTKIETYGPEAVYNCKTTQRYKDALQNKLSEVCNIFVARDTIISVEKHHTDNIYTCPAFAHTMSIVNEDCPEGYKLISSTDIREHTVNTCLGVVEDATAGEYVGSYHCN